LVYQLHAMPHTGSADSQLPAMPEPDAEPDLDAEPAPNLELYLAPHPEPYPAPHPAGTGQGFILQIYWDSALFGIAPGFFP
jgi:hypothetical protein